MNPLISTCCVSPSTGEDHHEDRISPFQPSPRILRSTPKRIFQRMISWALPKSDPVGDALQSTALRSTDDDVDDDDEVIQWWNPT